jgi:hypothetical protein
LIEQNDKFNFYFLQVLDMDLEKYIRFFSYDELIVCTDDGRANKLLVLMKNSPKMKTELGFLWKQMCLWNNFVAGNVVRFKFGTFNRCHLFKVI